MTSITQPRISGIYQILNIVNGKKYIGSSSHVHGRWTSGHKKHLRARTHANLHLQAAWDKYGENSFTLSVLECCEKDELLGREQYYLDHVIRWDFDYNVSRTANGVNSPESTRKIQEALRLMRLEPGYVHPLRGKKRSLAAIEKNKETWRLKLLDPNYVPPGIGTVHSQESLEKRKESWRFKIFDPTYVHGGLGKKKSAESLQKKENTIRERSLDPNYISPYAGRKRSKETMEKIRNTKLRKRLDPNYIDPSIGKKLSPETIAKRTATWRKNREQKILLSSNKENK